MTDFPEEGRYYCRNPRCKLKLPRPIANLRNAFCSAGCRRQFYRFRCFVCESAIERKSERALTCGKPKCDSGLETLRTLPGYDPPWQTASYTKKPVNTALKQPDLRDRGVDWALNVNKARIIAPRYVLDREFRHVTTFKCG